MRLIDRATGKPPVLGPGDSIVIPNTTITVDSDGRVIDQSPAADALVVVDVVRDVVSDVD